MNRNNVKSILVIVNLALGIGLIACAERTPREGQSLNRGQDALEVARAEAVLNFSCPKMKADPRVGKVRENDAESGLFSEYLVRVTGCGETAEYRVSCRAGGLCAVEE
ncbi:MAG: hypothetical protein RLZZ627_2057 [Pseudomonadota bacterium]